MTEQRWTDQNVETIKVTKDLHEIKEHGNLEYPVAIYEVDLQKMYMGMVRWHWHDEIEIIYVEKGCAEFCVSEETYVLSEGQGIFINQSVMHSVHPYEGEDCLYYSIVFHPAFLFGYGHAGLSSLYLHPITGNRSLSSVSFTGDDDFHRELRTLTQNVVSVNLQLKYCFELYTKEYLLHMWILLLEHCTAVPDGQHVIRTQQIGLDESRAKSAIRFIEEHFAEPITLDDIAASIHVSKSECCRCIRRCLKMTPFEYLMKYRIFVAAGRICQEDYDIGSIATLASSVGFNSSSYFNKLFRKYLNCTPTQYRVSLTSTQEHLHDVFGSQLKHN